MPSGIIISFRLPADKVEILERMAEDVERLEGEKPPSRHLIARSMIMKMLSEEEE